MKLKETRPMCGPHNGTQSSVALPVPAEIKGQGEVRMSWRTHEGADGKEIHSISFRDEDDKFIASHTLSNDEVRPWDKVVYTLKTFRKNALKLMDKFNQAL